MTLEQTLAREAKIRAAVKAIQKKRAIAFTAKRRKWEARRDELQLSR